MNTRLPKCPYCDSELQPFHQISLVHGENEPPKQDNILLWVCIVCEKNAMERLYYGSSAFGRYVDVSPHFAYIPLDIVFGREKNMKKSEVKRLLKKYDNEKIDERIAEIDRSVEIPTGGLHLPKSECCSCLMTKRFEMIEKRLKALELRKNEET